MRKALAMGILACITAGVLGAVPVLAAGGYDVHVKFIKTENTPQTLKVPTIVAKRADSGNVCGGLVKTTENLDFNSTYELDLYSTFTTKTKKGDKIYLRIPIEEGQQLNIYNLNKVGVNLTDEEKETWFTVGDLNCLAFNCGEGGRCTINVEETEKMNVDRAELLHKAQGYAVKVYADNQLIPLTAEPVIIDRATYLPMRDIANVCDLQVDYYDVGTDICKKFGSGEKAVAAAQIAGVDKAIYFPIDTSGHYTTVAQVERFTKGTGAKLINGRTVIPIRNLVEFAGFGIRWDETQNRIDIDTTNE